MLKKYILIFAEYKKALLLANLKYQNLVIIKDKYLLLVLNLIK